VSAAGIITEFQRENTPESINRKENVEELLNAIQAFATGKLDAPGAAPGGENEQQVQNQVRTLALFMQDIALVSDVDEKDDNPNKVSLMTIHAAKGLEFPYVYVTGLEENLFPNTQMLASQADLEEERRLFYVAVTRAERNLTLSYAQLRFRWGDLVMCEPSRFLDEIDEDLLLQIPKKMSLGETPSLGLSQKSEIINHKVHKGFTQRTQGFDLGDPCDLSPFGGAKGGRVLAIKNTPLGEAPRSVSDKFKRVSDFSSGANAGASQKSHVKQGMRVEHQKFGVGTVISVEGVGDNAKAHVDFDNSGTKMLMLRFAVLKEMKDE
jgi:DNA helicase-2/ATP-dependent DNA helicase PcrA